MKATFFKVKRFGKGTRAAAPQECTLNAGASKGAGRAASVSIRFSFPDETCGSLSLSEPDARSLIGAIDRGLAYVNREPTDESLLATLALDFQDDSERYRAALASIKQSLGMLSTAVGIETGHDPKLVRALDDLAGRAARALYPKP